ncbi:hypothetical protein KIPB_012743 [Kipferlia bialata]|uniref:Uncharacterized protein n=1 Tax=Kipferlia bialata TaxID=797122 RepID=A0A9K3GN88_9EUKA|nr:hypothetical protein KIPB_012743 [Kipferlia bialata]|eukprot:g12743.t1
MTLPPSFVLLACLVCVYCQSNVIPALVPESGEAQGEGFNLLMTSEFTSMLRGALKSRDVRTVWVIGPNGHGKSLMLSMIMQTLGVQEDTAVYHSSSAFEATTKGAQVHSSPLCMLHTPAPDSSPSNGVYSLQPLSACPSDAPAVLLIDTEGTASFDNQVLVISVSRHVLELSPLIHRLTID